MAGLSRSIDLIASQATRLSRLAIPGVLGLAIGGCSTAVVLKDAALAACGSSTVYLNGWYAGVADPAAVENDPIGGYQLVYWIDDAGNACHGDPSRNGQPGPAAIIGFRSQARAAAQTQAVITLEQLRQFQEIPLSLAYYSGSGPHFAQFYNTIWRSRADGTTFQSNSAGVLAIPDVVEIGSKACTAPIAFRVPQVLPLPSMAPSSTQDPVRCKVRARPSGPAMSEAERKAANVFSLPNGTVVFNVP